MSEVTIPAQMSSRHEEPPTATGRHTNSRIFLQLEDAVAEEPSGNNNPVSFCHHRSPNAVLSRLPIGTPVAIEQFAEETRPFRDFALKKRSRLRSTQRPSRQGRVRKKTSQGGTPTARRDASQLDNGHAFQSRRLHQKIQFHLRQRYRNTAKIPSTGSCSRWCLFSC